MLLKKLYNNYVKNKKAAKLSVKENIKLIEMLKQEIDRYLTQNDYLYEFDYQEKRKEWARRCWEIKQKISNPVKGIKSWLYGLIDIQKECNEKYIDCQKELDELIMIIKDHNKRYMDMAITEAYKIIPNIEGSLLDRQQMEAIVKHPDNQLVVAGAGTGKTTTIIGKVKYILAKEMCREDEICVLSFTKAAAQEMEERLYAQTKKKIHVSTFHSLGLEILRQTNGVAPIIYSANMSEFIKKKLKEYMQIPEYVNEISNYIFFNRIPIKSEFEFKNQNAYQEYLKINPPTTILGEKVKSYGEMVIANFLTQHSIKYLYEKVYPYDTRTEKFDQYQPDFYLPEYNIYIEYYGINKKKEVPSYFRGKNGKTASQIYCEGIEWKRKIHRQYNTTLIECYAYDYMDGKLQDKLKQELLKYDILMIELQIEEVFQHLSEEKNKFLGELAKVMQTVILLAKGQRMTAIDLIKISNYQMAQQRSLINLTVPIMEAYDKYLREQKMIDFADMLNLATDTIGAGKYHHKYKYVIVDEYQDLSSGQYYLLKSMRHDKNYKLFCVGDDWQSIYRFNGSNIGYILNFYKHWGNTDISKIETTYRFPQKLVDISSTFIMKNPNQLRKHMISKSNITEEYVLSEIREHQETYAVRTMIDVIEELPENSTIYFIGRYKHDIDMLMDSRLQMKYDKTNENIVIILSGREDLKMKFYTAHRSKGLQADYVFIINNKDTGMGFPSKIQNAPLVEWLLGKQDSYDFAEERRLFYVALTRAKRRVWIITLENNFSAFAQELLEQYSDEIKKGSNVCLKCGAPMQKRKGPYGTFWGCTKYMKTGCTYKKPLHI